MSWAELMKRVFLIDVEICPHCGGKRSVISQVTKPEAIKAILECLGLPCRAPPIHTARASPEAWLGFEGALA